MGSSNTAPIGETPPPASRGRSRAAGISRGARGTRALAATPPPEPADSGTPPQSERGHEGEGSRNTLRYIILGVLGAHPMSGYDIKRAFDRSLATYWNAGNSQIYTTLKALAAQGLVDSRVVEQEARPNRRVYTLTPAGRAALDAWLLEPVPGRFTKDEFLTKLFFCGQTSDEAALRHLEEHRTALHAQLADMEWALRAFGDRPTRRPRLLEFQMLVREYKQAALQADLEITERSIARLRERMGQPGDARDAGGEHSATDDTATPPRG